MPQRYYEYFLLHSDCNFSSLLCILCGRIKNLMSETPTSYSLLVMFKDVIYAVRDPYGNRPLCIGRLVPISKLHSSGIVSILNMLH